MDHPLISVIIPHRPDRILFYLDTIKNQTYPNIEIVVETDHNFTGAPATRNRGADRANGEFLFFCDDDIELKPDCLMKLYKAMQERQPVGCEPAFAYCHYEKTGAITGIEESLPWDEEKLKERNYISTMSLVRACDFWEAGFDESLKRYQDWDLWLTMAENGCWGVQVPEVLFTAHYEDDSISTQGPESRVLNTNILMAKHRISSDPISIIIPTYANANVLNRCLRTIKMNTVGEYEVILIDDSPYPDGRFSNEVKDIAARYGKVFFYRPGSRLHHTGCINFAMNYAQYENLCFLNDDTMVSHFWNTKLITAFNRLPKASCIGPMTSKSASVQEIHVLAKTRHIMNESNINLIQCFLEKEYKPKSICAKITGFCFVTNKDMLDKIGEFDEGIKAGGNEADWIIRGLKYELYPYVRTDTYVHHYGGLSYIGNERKKQWDNGLDTIKKKHGEKLVDFLENDLYLKLLKG